MALQELLDLDAAVFAEYWTQVLDDVAATAGGDVRTVVDLGSGTGTGALGLAQRFPGAAVTAVDSDEEMLAAIRAKNDRVTTLLADLDASWPPIADVDITFASMSLHHLANPERVLAQLADSTRPGGVVAAAEFREPVRVLRDDYGTDDSGAGIEQRTLGQLRAGHPLPELEADWATRFRAAGFEVVAERAFDLDLPAPVSADAQRYATRWLERMRHGANEHLAPGDRDDFAALLDAVTPADLHLHGRRTLTIARKPR